MDDEALLRLLRPFALRLFSEKDGLRYEFYAAQGSTYRAGPWRFLVWVVQAHPTVAQAWAIELGLVKEDV